MTKQAKAPVLFPSLRGKTWAEIDLAAWAEKQPFDPAEKNPLLDPQTMDKFVDYLHAVHGADHSYGGYTEDRAQLWHDSYLQKDNARHLGIDLNVPYGTPVKAARPSRVHSIFHDPEKDGGWGTAIVFELLEPLPNISHYLIAHLASMLAPTPGDIVAPDKPAFAVSGRPHENGGWFAHIHVQAFSPEAWAKYGADFSKFDGYAPNRPESFAEFPDPSPLIFAP